MKAPTSIRAKVTLASSIVSAIAMIAIVFVSSFLTKSILSNSIAETVENHLDVLQVELEAGVRDLSIEGTGAELIQVIDEDGEVLASSRWAEGVSAISSGGFGSGEASRVQVDDMQLQQGVSRKISDGQVAEVDHESGSATDAGISSSGGTSTEGSGGKTSTNLYDATRDRDEDDDDDDREELDDDREDGFGREDEGDELDDDDDVDDEDSHQAETHAAESSAPSPASFFVGVAYADEPAGGQDQAVGISSLLGADGPFVLIERGVNTPTGDVTIAAIASINPAYEAARVIALILGSILILTVTCVAWMSWFMASSTLRPVIDMREEVEAIGANALNKRVPLPKGDPDLLKLATTFNGLLERVDKAMTEQKRFISDASHELKSPVAATRVMLETAREHPEAIDPHVLLEDLANENERMGSIVGNLLLLAQHDEGMPRLEKHPIDLMDVLIEEASALRARSSVELDTSGVQPVVCSADGTALRHAVRNLLDNASRYARSLVRISCEEGEGFVRIVVSDDGPGIPASDRERVFGRFVRLEEGRCRQKGSTGLGLAVVKTVAEQHGGTAYFADPDQDGAVAVLEIEALSHF